MKNLNLLKTGLLLFLFPTWLFGCGNAIDCVIHGDNIKGHINFTGAAPLQTGKSIVIQYSSDGFSTIAGSSSIHNLQGLPSVAYTFCVANDVNAILRAFQDTDGDGNWSSGETAGRNDGTSTGNSSFTVHNLPRPQPSAVPPVEWKQDTGVDIWMDSTTAQ